MPKRISFVVSMDDITDLTLTELKSFILEAVEMWGRGGDPRGERWNIYDSRVSVRTLVGRRAANQKEVHKMACAFVRIQHMVVVPDAKMDEYCQKQFGHPLKATSEWALACHALGVPNE